MSSETLQRESRLPRAAIAVDVGGTTTLAALVTERGLVPETTRRILSQADGTRDVILSGLRGLIGQVLDAASQKYDVQAVGVGLPGPCNYGDGVSLMRHKFASLYGVPLREPLTADAGLDVVFFNDADAFALGAWLAEFSATDRLLGITLGTGVGSGFVVSGHVVAGVDGAPRDGDVWNLVFRSQTLEHFVSAAAIRRSYEHRTGEAKITVREIAELARTGNEPAASTFTTFGADLGEGIAVVTEDFCPDRIVLGGQISKAFDLFGRTAEGAYCEKTGKAVPWNSAQTEFPELIGAGYSALYQPSL